MATHSSVLAWRIPGTEDSGGLPSMGSHRVGHDWSNLVAAAAAASVTSFLRFEKTETHISFRRVWFSPGPRGWLESEVWFPLFGLSQVALVVNAGLPQNLATCQWRLDVGHAGSIIGLRRSPGEERGNLLRYSCLENPMDRGAWRATVHGVAQSRTRPKWLSTATY